MTPLPSIAPYPIGDRLTMFDQGHCGMRIHPHGVHCDPRPKGQDHMCRSGDFTLNTTNFGCRASVLMPAACSYSLVNEIWIPKPAGSEVSGQKLRPVEEFGLLLAVGWKRHTGRLLCGSNGIKSLGIKPAFF